MNGNDMERTKLDFIQFGVICIGFFVAAVGVVVTSIPAALGGFALILIGCAYFLVKQWLEE